jgi:hypothetical protein
MQRALRIHRIFRDYFPNILDERHLPFAKGLKKAALRDKLTCK